MILVDSSGWIEHLTGGPLADAYTEYLAAPDLLVPTIVLCEVYKFVRREISEEVAMRVAARLKSARMVPLDESLALEAADLSLDHGLPMADAIVYVYATAQAHQATLVTSDEHFAGLAGVTYLEKKDK